MCTTSVHSYHSIAIARVDGGQHDSHARHSCVVREDVGSYLSELRQVPLLTAEEEQNYAQRARSGEQKARNLLIRHNLRLVVSIARRYRADGLSFADLIGGGNLGLIRAVDKFDPQRGHRFVVYAAWWVRQAIDQTAREQRSVVLKPRRLVLQQRRQQRVLREHWQEHGQDGAGQLSGPPSASSPDHFLDADGSGAWSDMLPATLEPGEDYLSPCRKLEREQLLQKIREWLSYMPPQQAQILTRYFGLDDQPGQTLLQIAEQLQLSRQQVISLRNRALVSLRESFVRHRLDAGSLLQD